MTSKQIDRLRAFKSVRQMLEKSRAIWSQDLGITNAVDGLDEEIKFLNEAHATQFRGSRQATRLKKEQKLELTNRMMSLSGATLTYAAKINDKSLMQSADFSRAKLLRLRDEEFAIQCRDFYKIVSDLDQNALISFGISGPTMETFDSLLNVFEIASQGPRLSIAERKAVTAQIRASLKSARKIVHKQLKNQLSTFMESHPVFWNEFLAAMIIVDTGPVTRTGEETPVA